MNHAEALTLELSRQAAVLLPKVAWGLLAVAAFWYAGSIAQRGLLRRGVPLGRDRAELLELLARALAVALRVCGAVVALGTLGVNVSALVAGLGLTGFALGFALKDAFSNVMAGCMILFYRPFRKGDRIAVTGLEGIVSEIDLRYTRLEDAGKAYLIPNSILLSQAITVVRPDAPRIS